MPQVDVLTFFNIIAAFVVFFSISYDAIYKYCVKMEKIKFVRKVFGKIN